jgi:hypothetical protein
VEEEEERTDTSAADSAADGCKYSTTRRRTPGSGTGVARAKAPRTRKAHAISTCCRNCRPSGTPTNSDVRLEGTSAPQAISRVTIILTKMGRVDLGRFWVEWERGERENLRVASPGGVHEWKTGVMGVKEDAGTYV